MSLLAAADVASLSHSPIRRMPNGSVLLVTGHEGRQMYAQYCRGQGLVVTDAIRPEQALLLLDGLAPGVVVTDIVFPDSAVDGKAFIRTLRQRIDPLTSIIVLSGYAREEDREGARRSGADVYLIQPTAPQDLAETIINALTLRRRGRRLPWNWRTGQLAALNTDLGRRQSFIARGHRATLPASNLPRRAGGEPTCSLSRTMRRCET